MHIEFVGLKFLLYSSCRKGAKWDNRYLVKIFKFVYTCSDKIAKSGTSLSRHNLSGDFVSLYKSRIEIKMDMKQDKLPIKVWTG